jgi:hypothetical protein
MRTSKSEATQGRGRKKCFQEENGMSSPVTPPQGPISAGPVPPTGATRRARPAPDGPAFVESSAALKALAEHPPREVLDQVAQADQRYESLRAQGRELRFSRDAPNGRTTIEVRDRNGKVLKQISPSQALEIAAGAPLE